MTSTVRRLLEDLEPRARVLPQRVRTLDVGAGLEDQALSARAELFAGQHVLNQPGEHGFVHRRETHQTGVQALQLRLRESVQIHPRCGLGRAHGLPPAQQDFGVACRVDRTLAQATFDFCIRWRLALTACGTTLAAQPCGFTRLLR